ncbi:L-threonine O-3-phosphate decarboxylase [Marinomonas balearica]|uniref:Aminotransferase n=1 Tax=Marinomonas balearica TaxID=491947 RepID=A0A4V3CGJ7_9GAMM|nr:L-threonine O-3-phosphate decarboxylase [Marinomonas balearica]
MHFDLTPLKHGGDLKRWSRLTNGVADDWLDLSSACNREPWPIPNIPNEEWHELPDQNVLYKAASEYFKVKPIAIGSGSQQFIEVLPVLFSANTTIKENARKIVKVPKIGYKEHAFAWKKWGFSVQSYEHLDELIDSTWFTAVVVNPNNPTAEMASVSTLEKLLIQVRSTSNNPIDGLEARHLVVDEAFMDATPEYSLLTNHIEDIALGNVWVMRSVGKFFGLPGARVGFLFAAHEYANSINNLIGPWAVATPALYLVAKALRDSKWQTCAREALSIRHQHFWQIIRPKLNTVFDSQAVRSNALFYTWQLDTEEETEQAFDWLHRVGIHVRRGECWIRVALPAMAEMDQLDKGLIRLIRGDGLKDLS